MDKPDGFDEPKYYTNYNEYMHSELWYRKREERMKIDGFKCINCKSPYNLEVHHTKYPRLFGTENVQTDLVTLCNNCHRLIHQKESELKNQQDALMSVYHRQQECRDTFVKIFCEQFKHLDYAFGGKENFCKYETIDRYWRSMFGGSSGGYKSRIVSWFRDRRIEKIFEMKSLGATKEDVARTGISRRMIDKYWYEKEQAERIVGHELQEGKHYAET